MTCAECEQRPALRDDPYYRCLECKRREDEYSGPDDIGDTTGSLPMDEAHRMEEARRLK